MKRMFCVMLCFCMVLFFYNIPACAKGLSLSAQAYVLYCVENETVIMEHNSDVRMKPASTTKIMTTLLALEEAKKRDRLVVFDESMSAEGSSMYLKNGDVVHLSSLAKGMMMASGNDAANAVALTLSNSIESFSCLMNERAKEISMNNTHFVTPSGLDDDNHYTTAYDMALLMAYAMENEDFADIVKNEKMDVRFLAPEKQVTYHNHNRLLSLYEYCIGGKTGYTKSAGRCLVSVSRKDDCTLVCVTFNAGDDWNDHIKLYDYGFEKYKSIDTDDTDENFTIDIVGGNKNSTPLYCKNIDVAVVKTADAKKVTRTVYIPAFVYAPIKADTYVGAVVYKLDGKIIAQNPLYTQSSVEYEKTGFIKSFLHKITD